MVTVLVVGAGSMGFNHARNYAAFDEVNKVVVVDSSPSALENVRKAGFDHLELYADLDDALKEEEIDAASVATTTPHHFSVAKKLLENGVPTLVEKPICDREEQAKELIALAHKKKAILMVGHIERFNPAVSTLKKHVASIGDIVYASAHRFGIPTPRKLGKAFLDQAVHDIDVIAYLSDQKPKAVQAMEQKWLDADAEDLCAALYEFETFTASVEANRVTPIKTRELIILGTKGSAKLDYITQELVIMKSDGEAKKYNTFDDIIMRVGRGSEIRPYFVKDEPLKLELKHFLHCAKTGETPLVTGEDGLHALQAVDAGIRSAKSGKKEKVG